MMPKRPVRRGFTLLEMMIAIVIFALITIFLYRSLDTLRDSTRFYGKSLDAQQRQTMIVKTLFLDLVQSENNATRVISEERQADTLLMQTAHSVHRRIMPYVGYAVREGTLYRFETVQAAAVPLEPTEHIVVDRLEPVDTFRVYANASHFLVDLRFKGSTEQLMKVPRSDTMSENQMENDASDTNDQPDSNASSADAL